MKKYLLTIILFTLSVSSLHAAKSPFFIPPSAFSASYSSGSFSSLANPVFTDRDQYPALAYSFIKQDEHGWDHFASLNVLDFDFIYSRYGSILLDDDTGAEANASLFTINRGFLYNNTFGFGLGVSFSHSGTEELDDYRGWHAGFLLRPTWFLSFAAVFRDIDARSYNNTIKRTETYSASIRPFTEHITLTADATRYPGDKDEKTDYSFGLELNGYQGISFTCKGDTDKNFTFGLSCPFSLRGRGPAILKLDGYAGVNSSSPDFTGGGFSITAAREKRAIQVKGASNTLYILISDNFSDENSTSGILSGDKTSFHQLATGIRRAADDMTIDSIILDIDHVSLGFAQLQEIRRELMNFRKSGRKVHALMSYTGNKEYYLASCADRIYFTPNSPFAITGLKLQSYFIKGLIDRVGLKYESVSKGKYKSFNETFTRENMSPEARENMQQILSDFNGQFIKGITEGRNIPRERVDELFKEGFYLPQKAMEKGFIDEIIHRENAISEITGDERMLKFEDYISETERITRWGRIPEIAVIHVNGTIVSGKGSDSLLSSSTGDFDYRDALEKAFTSSAVKGIVIRIDSGGGSASASDYMWNYLLLMKKRYPKPVIFSFGNVAASGGYYIACTGDKIITESGTITGSIGVVAGKVSLKELYAKLGISTETIKMSEFADSFSEARDLTGKERELLQQGIDFTYDRFTGRVIEGRKIPASKIPDIAEGRIHTGNTARKEGLADGIGGLLAAIEYAKEMSNTGGECAVKHYPERGGFFSRVLDLKASESIGKSLELIIKTIQKVPVSDDKIYYISPYSIEIE